LTVTKLIFCLECEGIWGVLDVSDGARLDLISDAFDLWGVDVSDQITEGIAVYLTEAQTTFAADRFGTEIAIDDCWQNAEYVDAPGWWLASRPNKDALMLGCCKLSDNYRRTEKDCA